MANRDLNFSPDVTNVTPVQDTTLQLATGVADIGAKAADAAEQSKLLANTAQAHVAFKGLDAAYRTQYASDPNSKEGQQWLQEQRQAVTESLGDNISTFYQRQWTEKTMGLAAQSDVSNEMWAYKQNKSNTINNFKTTAVTYANMANQDGQAYGASSELDPSAIMNYISAQEALTKTAGGVLGDEKANELAHAFKSDYIKSFVSGVADKSPQKAAEMLNDPVIQENFTTQERGDMIEQIAKVKRQQTLQKNFSVVQNNAVLPDIVNDPNTSTQQKLLAIDTLNLQGSVAEHSAMLAKRVVHSQEAVDAQTDTPLMAKIINQTYDLNAQAQTNPDDYLRGVQNLQNTILDNQAKGQLTARDAGKLNKQISDLTSKRIADATQSVGNEFYDANQKFTTALPPEFRADATRQLFNAGDGKNFTPQQYSAAADQVIDNINTQRRQNALAAVKASNIADTQLLKSYGYTAADVAETAKNHHITEQQVIQKLRAQHMRRSGTGEEVQPPAPVELHHPGVQAEPDDLEQQRIDEGSDSTP